MNIRTAKKIIYEFYSIVNPTEEERFQYTEAVEYVLAQERSPILMTDYGGYYYAQKKFDLALKYYQMAADMGYLPAKVCLGYIWYYGRTGTKDYQKAFENFEFARQKGDLVATYKVADMYKNGYFVEKDEAKYISMIESLYEKVKDSYFLGDPVSDVCTRLARIRMAQNRKEEAVELFRRAKDFLQRMIRQNPFFGELNVMEGLIRDLYSLVEFDESAFDIYDLYYLLQKPTRVSFFYKKRQYMMETKEEDGELVIYFEGKAYKDVSDLLARARIGKTTLTSISSWMEDFTIESPRKESVLHEEI